MRDYLLQPVVYIEIHIVWGGEVFENRQSFQSIKKIKVFTRGS